jgi:hypothetical protein
VTTDKHEVQTLPNGKKYIILRGVPNNSLKKTPLPKPLNAKNIRQVSTLLNEEKLKEFGVVHFHSAFIEDRMHDWDITKKNELRFYGHSGEKDDLHDLVIVFE